MVVCAMRACSTSMLMIHCSWVVSWNEREKIDQNLLWIMLEKSSFIGIIQSLHNLISNKKIYLYSIETALFYQSWDQVLLLCVRESMQMKLVQMLKQKRNRHKNLFPHKSGKSNRVNKIKRARTEYGRVRKKGFA